MFYVFIKMILLTTLHLFGTIQKAYNDVMKVKNITNETNGTVKKINKNVKDYFTFRLIWWESLKILLLVLKYKLRFHVEQ